MTLLFLNGLWPIHLIFVAAAAAFFVRGVKEYKSGTVWGGSATDMQTHESDERVPVYKVPGFVFGAIVTVIYIVCLLFVFE